MSLLPAYPASHTQAAILSRFGPAMPPSCPHFASADYGFDPRAAQLRDLRAGFDRSMAAARVARAKGDVRAWAMAMDIAGSYRTRLMAMKRQGWRLGTGGRNTGKSWAQTLQERAVA